MRRSFSCARYAIAGFVLLTVASMSIYPGGTYRDRETAGYLFFSNFLSDLGMPTSWGGDGNALGAVLFVSGEILLATGVVLFFLGIVRLSRSVPAARIWGHLATVAGIAVAVALLVAAFTPANRLLSLHIEAALIAFRGAAVAATFTAVAIAVDRRFPHSGVLVAVLVAVVTVAYAAVVQWGPRITSDYGLQFQATAQKIMVTVAIAGIAYLSLIAQHIAPEAPNRSRDRLGDPSVNRATSFTG